MSKEYYKHSVSILGTGFIGVCSAACFADKGIKTVCSTHSKKKYEEMAKFKAPFYEAGLQEIMTRVGEKDKSLLKCYNNDVPTAVKETDIIMITQVPGSTRNLVAKLIEEVSGKVPGKDYSLCMQPEFLAEGRSIEDTLFPDRIIIGQFDEKSGAILENLYKHFYGKHLEKCPIVKMNLESAEFVKYGNNVLLSTKISYANEMSNLAQLCPNVDIGEVMKGVGLDYRINKRFLGAGVGYGGSCFHKDVNAIMAWGKSKGYNGRILAANLNINDDQCKIVIDMAEALLKEKIAGKRVCLMGLAFKPGTDDMRNAPSIRIVDNLRARGCTEIWGYDPFAKESAVEEFGEKIKYGKDLDEALKDADLAFLVTEWDEFRKLKPDYFKKLMKNAALIDGRRIYDYKLFKAAMKYRTFGRVDKEDLE